jgi:hypothetical protein
MLRVPGEVLDQIDIDRNKLENETYSEVRGRAAIACFGILPVILNQINTNTL